MIWYNKSLSHIRQISIAHSDICAVITRIASRTIFLASVYVPCSSGTLEKDNRRLESRLHWIRTAYRQEKDQCPELELILTGDFNRWNTLWGGSAIAHYPRQGEAIPLLFLYWILWVI